MRGLLQSVALLSLIFFFTSTVAAEDWVYYTRSVDSFFFDRSNINTPYEGFNNILGVWQKVVYEGESVNRIAAHLGVKYGNLKESVSMIEIDCSSKVAQIKAITFYDSGGGVIDTKSKTSTDWRKIPPDSSLNALYKTVCGPRLR